MRNWITRWQTHNMGYVHWQQDPGDPAAVVVGDERGVRAVRQLRGLRRHGQHVHGVRPEQQGLHRGRQDRPRTGGLRGLPKLL